MILKLFHVSLNIQAHWMNLANSNYKTILLFLKCEQILYTSCRRHRCNGRSKIIRT